MGQVVIQAGMRGAGHLAFEVRENIRSEERGKKLVNELIKEVTESVFG